MNLTDKSLLRTKAVEATTRYCFTQYREMGHKHYAMELVVGLFAKKETG